MPPNAVTTMKRKLDDLSGDEVTYGSQRQSVLNISMCKLRTSPRKRVEPSLRRSVLILNTLKHIETELQMEGVCFHSPMETAFNLTEMPLSEITLDPLPESDSTSSHMQVMYRSENLQTSMPKPIKQTAAITEGRLDISTKETEKTVLDLVPCRLVPEETPQGTKHPISKSSLQDTNNNLLSTVAGVTNSSTWNEDLFGDIDLAMYDFDFFSLSSAMKLTPLSADEVIHSFPGSQGHMSENFPTLINSQCGTYCKNDSMLDDLDNIMQILVGM